MTLFARLSLCASSPKIYSARRMADSNPSLSDKIGQMLLIGFRGYSVQDSDPVVRDIQERNLGSVIYFDQEMADTQLQGRNIQSPEQVQTLSQTLKAHARTPLLVSIDQEGGRVNRLKSTYGFPETLSHEELGQRNDPKFTFEHAETIAQTLVKAGINLNLAPVVDLDVNPDNPIIKGKKRSFHSDPEVVAQHAIEYARAHQKHGVLICPKHFPGHGSAMGDTHLGYVDVTNTWTERELIPFQRLFESGLCEVIMTAHVFNANLDPDCPATLSKRVLQGLLRDKLGYRGVITSDDMEMKAISGHYGLENAIQLGIEAGLDVLCFGNNMNYDANIGEKAHGIILRLVESGKISEARIDESYQRVMALKGKIS
ncbi:MAG: glycoside hydrolase family 3 protein [Verrucomicrobia bacterium]|nr:glycoside hydrolase family 3 protein [Verrucomicrobiota bacterium]